MPRRALAALLALALGIAACGSDSTASDAGTGDGTTDTETTDTETTGTAVTNPAAGSTGGDQAGVIEELDFVAPDVRGGQVTGADFAGQHLVVWFWAPW